MPMTNPGGGASALSALTDVSLRDDAGIDGAGLSYSAASGKWSATLNLATVPTISAWNPADKSTSVTLSNNNLTAALNSPVAPGVRGNTARSGGKYYMEFTCNGVSDTSYAIGFATTVFAFGGGPAPSSTEYITYTKDGRVHYNSGVASTIQVFAATNVVGVALDFSNNAVWFRTAGGNWNNNAAYNPSTNTGGIAVPLTTAKTLFPLFIADNTADSCILNAGGQAFANAVPSGFLPWDIFAPQNNTVPASPAAFTAPTSGMYAVSGGTVSAITLTRGNSAAINLGAQAGTFSVSQGDILTVTYTAAPTVNFIPLAD